jgi:hypothetical protein
MKYSFITFSVMCFLVLFSNGAIGQITPVTIYPNLAHSMEYFYPILGDRVTDARSEAMGKTITANGNKGMNSLSNPAIAAFIQGPQLSAGIHEPYFSLNKSQLRSISLTTQMTRRLHLGFNAMEFNNPEKRSLDVLERFISGDSTERQRYYSINASIAPRRLNRGLGIGVNISYLNWKTPNFAREAKVLYDVGLLYQLQTDSTWYLKIGASYSNIRNTNFAKNNFIGTPFIGNVPRQANVGISFQKEFGKKATAYHLRWLTAEASLQYKNYTSKNIQTMVSGGMELVILNILAVRGGYFYQYNDDKVEPILYYQNSKSFTYGAGLIVPFDKLTKSHRPLKISIDAAFVPQLAGKYDDDITKDYPTYIHSKVLTATVHWDFN